MEELSLSKNITNYILENHTVGFNSRGNIKIDDFSMGGNGLSKRFFNRFLSDRKQYKSIDESLRDMDQKEIQEELSNLLPTLSDTLINHLQAIEVNKLHESSDLVVEKDAYLNAIPVINVEDVKGRAFMIDGTTARRSLIEEKSWERVVGTNHVKLMREMSHCGRFKYDPRDSRPFTHLETSLGKETLYNLYVPPVYREGRDLKAKLDPVFIDFLEGLFLGSCRSYAYNWLYYSSFKRIPTYLVLVGAGGIGKNLLAEALKYVHTDYNFKKAPASALESKFNGHLENCTMLYYDECKFSAGAEGRTIRKNRLKEWANDCVPIENKGQDAINRDIFCSAILATNNDSDIHLERLDRKFSVMELSEDRLEKRLGADTTQKLWEYIKDPSFPDAFLNYLEDKIDPDFNPHMEYKGTKFEDLVLSSLYGWQSELLEMITGGTYSYIVLKDCKENISRFPTRHTKVDDFLKNFTHEGETLGKIVLINGKPNIKVNEKFCPTSEEGSL